MTTEEFHSEKKRKLTKAGDSRTILVKIKNGQVTHLENLPEEYDWKVVDEDARKKKSFAMFIRFLQHYKDLNYQTDLQIIENLYFSARKRNQYYQNDTSAIASVVAHDMDEDELLLRLCKDFTEEQIFNFMLDSLRDLKEDEIIINETRLTESLCAYMKDLKVLPSNKLLEACIRPVYYVWGFDLTDFGHKGGFQKLLAKFKIPLEAKVVQVGYSEDVDRYLWKRDDDSKDGVELITACNPITGKYPADKKHDFRIYRCGFASYMGLRSRSKKQRDKAVKLIRRQATMIKGESENTLNTYLGFTAKKL